jgi:hypothetical protein
VNLFQLASSKTPVGALIRALSFGTLGLGSLYSLAEYADACSRCGATIIGGQVSIYCTSNPYGNEGCTTYTTSSGTRCYTYGPQCYPGL